LKIFIALIFSFFSLSILATEEIQSPKICYTHGQCQTEAPEYGPRCLLVKTGSTVNGNSSCSIRCPSIPIGSYCEPVVGHIWGVCKKESYPMPSLDSVDCSSAIDPDEL